MDYMNVAEELKYAWSDLHADVKKYKKLKLEIFEDLFSRTYSLLAEHLTEQSLDKSVVGMVAEAYLFANIKDDTLGNNCLAAFVLTERMLHYTAFGNGIAIEPVSIYIADARRDVRLSFSNVDESISTLVKVFESVYRKKELG